MSNATTVKQANEEHLSDLKRLHQAKGRNHMDWLRTLDEQAKRFANLKQQHEAKINAAGAEYEKQHKKNIEDFIVAELGKHEEE
jgi:hypothetical protein